MDDFEKTVLRKLCAMADAINWGDQQIAEIKALLSQKPRLRKAATIILNAKGEFLPMSTSLTQTLVNVANPAAATRALEVIDVTGGTTLPDVVATTGAALVAIVAATALNAQGQFIFGVYPIDANAETNDPVVVTASLADGSSVTFNYTISGSPEALSIDAASSVGAFVGAPAVPATPV